MHTKFKHPINNQPLNEINWDVKIINIIMQNLANSELYYNAFQHALLSFVSFYYNLRGIAIIPQYERMEALIEHSRFLGDPSELIVSLINFIDKDETEIGIEPSIVFHNAFIYAVASCYSKQIMSGLTSPEPQSIYDTMMKLSRNISNRPTIIKPSQSDNYYYDYVAKNHPFLLGYVKSQHHFINKKILYAIGYLGTEKSI